MRSMRMGFGKGIVALEEEQERIEELAGDTRRTTGGEEPPVVDPEDEVEDHTDLLENDLIEVADDVADGEEISDSVDEGLDTVEALEELRLVTAAAAKNGGFDKTAAQVARVSLEHLYRKAGLKVKRATPAIESFGGVSDRVRSTIALEAEIKANVAKIWEHIVAAVKKAIEFVVNLFHKIFQTAEGVKQRAAKLAEQAGKMDSHDLKEKEIDNGRLAEALHLDGAVPNNASGAQRLHDEYSEIYRDYPQLLDGVNKMAEGAANGDAGAREEAAQAISKITLGLKAVANPGAEGFQAEQGIAIVRSEELPGGKALVLHLPSNLQAAAHAGGGIAPYSAKSAQFKGDKVPLFEAEVAAQVAKLVETIATEVLNAKSVVGKMTEAKKKLISAVEAAAKASSEASHKDAAGLFKAGLSFIDKPFVTLNTYTITASKALLEQVEQSLRAHEVKPAPAGTPQLAAPK